MATNEQTLDDLLNSVIKGEASDETKAQCLCLAIDQDNINLAAIQTLLDHGADPNFILPEQWLPAICRAARNFSDNVDCLKLLLEYQGQKADEDLYLKTDEQHDQITDEQNDQMTGEHQNQKPDENPDHNSEDNQHQKTDDDPNQKTDDHPYHKTDENEDQKTDENEDQKSDENEEQETDENKKQQMLALAADASGLTTGKQYRQIKTVKQSVLNKLLVHASVCLNSKCVTYLLDKGACVNYENKHVRGRTPLVAACFSTQSDEARRLQTVNILLNHGANTLARDSCRRTTLHWAADRGLTSVINRLLDAGCDVNMQNDDQHTPLIVLVRNGMGNSNIEAIKNLLKFGAKIEYANDENNSRSALFHGVFNDEVVELLLQEGADPYFVDTSFLDSCTLNHSGYVHKFPLTKAIDWNKVKAVKLFIQYNCDVNIRTRDRNGKSVSAFRLSASQEHSLVMFQMLALAGCDRLEMNKCITAWDSERLQSANAHLWQEVKEMASSPFMLKQLSRLNIRHHFRHLGRRIMVVFQLPLPKLLQEYLMFKELDNYIDA